MRKGGLPRGLGGGCRARIIEALAQGPPQTVKAIATKLHLSYMGVKSQCIKLERAGYLASARRGGNRGRPEVLYRLTPKGRQLLPHGGSDLAQSLLTQAARVFGAQAANKLLFLHFEAKGEAYATTLSEIPLAARAEALCATRTAEGHFSSFEDGPPPQLIEGHNPLMGVFEAYPEAAGFETAALSRALGITLRREPGKSGETRFLFLEAIPAEDAQRRPAQPPEPPAPAAEDLPPPEAEVLPPSADGQTPPPAEDSVTPPAEEPEIEPAESTPQAEIPPPKDPSEQREKAEEPFRLVSDF